MIRSKDPVRTYSEAVAFLKTAVDALDQAHAALKDINLDNYLHVKVGVRYTSLLDAVAIVDKIYEDAKAAVCEACGQPLAGNKACLSERCPDVTTWEELGISDA